MISPREIKTKALRRYKDTCRQWICGEDPYPLPLRVSLSFKGLGESDIFAGLEKLYQASKEVTGFGYILEFEERKTRSRGVQSIPRRIVIPSRKDHLKLISREKEFAGFKEDIMAIENLLPDGGISWCEKNLSLILRNTSHWAEITNYVRYLQDNPDLNYSPREVPVADSKFFERHRPAVTALASEVLGYELSGWELKSRWRPSLRFLDPALRICGFSKISIELEELSLFSPPETAQVRQVLILENGASFNALPDIEKTLAIWGEGNAVQALKGIQWLESLPLFYWGDMDMDGLAILARFRSSFPHVKSLAMELEDFLEFEEFAVDSSSRTRPDGSFLTEGENRLKEYLADRSKDNRLEQERVPLEYALRNL